LPQIGIEVAELVTVSLRVVQFFDQGAEILPVMSEMVEFSPCFLFAKFDRQ
jgi:hypothetical protein